MAEQPEETRRALPAEPCGTGAGGRDSCAFRNGRRGEPRGGDGAGRSAVRGTAGVWKRDAGKGNEPRDVALSLGGRFLPRCALRVANTRKVSRLRGGWGGDPPRWGRGPQRPFSRGGW